MVKTQNIYNVSAGEDEEHQELLLAADGNTKWHSSDKGCYSAIKRNRLSSHKKDMEVP